MTACSIADGTTTVAHQIEITAAMTLTGSATDNVTVQVTNPGNTLSRVFHVNAPDDLVTIKNMTIKGGRVDQGGAVYLQQGELNLETVYFSDGTAISGGGVYNAAGAKM